MLAGVGWGWGGGWVGEGWSQGDTVCHFPGHHKAVISLALCDAVA